MIPLAATEGFDAPDIDYAGLSPVVALTVGLVVVQQIAGRLEGLLLQQIATPDDVFQDHYRALAAELAEAWQRGLDTISTIS